MKPAIATLFLLLLATQAHATGLPAPLQADYDIGIACEGARWAVFRYDGFTAPWVGATGFCESLGSVWPVEWACNPATGARGVMRKGWDPGFRRVNEFSPQLTDRELCR